MRTSFLNLLRITALVAALPATASATSLSFSNLTARDFDNVVREFSANFSFSTVTPASTLGGLGGFELGVVGGTTTANDTYDLVKRASPSTNWKNWVPHGGVLARVGLPYAFTVEALIFPKINVSSVKFSNYSGSLMWTPTELYWENAPVTIATKFHYTISTISYSQTITDTTFNQSVTATPSFKDKLWGLQAIFSRKIAVLEPYLGLGYVKAKGDFAINNPLGGLANLFSSTSGYQNSASSSPSSFQLLLGADLTLGFFSLGGEYQSVFSTHSWNGRLSFRF